MADWGEECRPLQMALFPEHFLTHPYAPQAGRAGHHPLCLTGEGEGSQKRMDDSAKSGAGKLRMTGAGLPDSRFRAPVSASLVPEVQGSPWPPGGRCCRFFGGPDRGTPTSPMGFHAQQGRIPELGHPWAFDESTHSLKNHLANLHHDPIPC